MRKVIYSHMVSLDGFIETDESYQGPNWATTDQELLIHFKEIESLCDTHLYGRRVFQAVSTWWPIADKDPNAPDYIVEYSKIWKDKLKYVFSTTLDHADWNTKVIKKNAPDVVKELKSQKGKDLFLYGGTLASSLMRFNLIDEFRLYYNPVFIGKGVPMIPSMEGVFRLKLIETKVFGCGVVLLHYSNQDTLQA